MTLAGKTRAKPRSAAGHGSRAAGNSGRARAAGEPLAELQRNALRAAKLLKAMSNSARLVVLCQLADGERSVGELERAVGLSQSGISQHLAVLRREGVVSSRRVSQTVLYSLASREVAAIMTTLYSVFCQPGAAAHGVHAPSAPRRRASPALGDNGGVHSTDEDRAR